MTPAGLGTPNSLDPGSRGGRCGSHRIHVMAITAIVVGLAVTDSIGW